MGAALPQLSSPCCHHLMLCYIDKAFVFLTSIMWLKWAKSFSGYPAAFGDMKHLLNSIKHVDLCPHCGCTAWNHRKNCSYWLLSPPAFRKGSTGDGPREGELEDLHEDEPSSWVLMTLSSTELCLQLHPLYVPLLEPPLHPHVSSKTVTHHKRIILYTGETQGFKSDVSLVLTFRLVRSGLLLFLLPVSLRVSFLTPIPPIFLLQCGVSGQ